MRQAILFDCDGVLVDTERDGHREAFNRAFARRGYDVAWDVALYGELLRLNASELVHGAYGLEEGAVVITDTIQSPNLDLNEIQGSIDSVVMALTSHYEHLSQYRNKT